VASFFAQICDGGSGYWLKCGKLKVRGGGTVLGHVPFSAVLTIIGGGGEMLSAIS